VPRALPARKELPIAWTLLLLGDGDLHGYKLHRGLHARGLAIQPATTYRQLRAFEQHGWVTSRWTQSSGGQRRHLYRITADGWAALHEISALVAHARDTYAAFVHAHEHSASGRAAAADRAVTTVLHSVSPTHPVTTRGPPPAEPAAGSPPSPARAQAHGDLLAGWLLLHLELRATYGYDLRRAVDAARGLTIDPGTLYRALRRFEAEGWVRSRWRESVAGPPRRMYRLTSKGLQELDHIAAAIAALRDAHDAYLHAHRNLHRPDSGAAGP
jgi:DNA-binding PadR family transcriptional regulator